MAKGNRGGKRGKNGGAKAKANGIKYLSEDKALYESPDEVIYAERMEDVWGSSHTVLEADSDGHGNIYLSYASPVSRYQQNKSTTYALYEVKCGVAYADEIHGSRKNDKDYGDKWSKVKPENIAAGNIRSAGIDWSKVNSISGRTFNVKELLKDKGFKWNSADKNWVKKE
mgnify:CR=1 FL=1